MALYTAYLQSEHALHAAQQLAWSVPLSALPLAQFCARVGASASLPE